MANTKTAAKKKTAGPVKKTAPKKNTAKSSGRPSPRSLEEIRQRNQVKAVILFASALLMAFLVFIKGENVWAWFHDLLMGLFGGWAIMWPLLMIYVAVVIALEKPNGKVSSKIWMTALVIVLICTTVFVFSDVKIPTELGFFEYIGYLFNNGVANGGAGLVGGIIGNPLIIAVGTAGAKIIVTLLLFVSVMLLTGTTLIQLYKALPSRLPLFQAVSRTPESGGRKNAGFLRKTELILKCPEPFQCTR